MKKDNVPNPQNLRRIDRVDSAQTSKITEDNKLVKCRALVITHLLGIKEIKNKKKEEPFWKRRIESNMNILHKDVCLI